MIKKINTKIIALQDWIDLKIRGMEERVSQKGKVIIVLVMLILFGGGSIFMMVSSIYNLGKKSGRQIEIKHIQQLEPEKRPATDSITN